MAIFSLITSYQLYRLFVLISFCCIYNTGKSQCETNLVRNGGFEELNYCPPTITQEYHQLNERAVGWYNPSLQTADVFNTCMPYVAQSNGGGYIPDNYWGYQYPQSGNGYGGLAVPCGDAFSEYLQNELTSTMIAGSDYEIEFWISSADTFDVDETGVYCTLRGLQFLFTPDQIFWPDITMIEGYTPQYTTGEVWLNDSIGWMHIKDTIVLEEDAGWMTIGRYNIAEIGGDCDCFPGKFLTAVTYYFIDDLSIKLLKPEHLQIPNVFSPNGDGRNDAWMVPEFCGETFIYNRWGNEMIRLKASEKWDGKSDNTDCSEGIYYFIARSEDQELNGFVQLLR